MPKRILIVEDDAAISRLLESNLRLSGYQLICTADGCQALELLQNQPFDLALCDIMLPEIDGFELLPHMRAQGVPVIFLSAKADVQSRVRGLRLGAEDYLVKPFDILELLVRMERCSRGRTSIRRGSGIAISPSMRRTTRSRKAEYRFR